MSRQNGSGRPSSVFSLAGLRLPALSTPRSRGALGNAHAPFGGWDDGDDDDKFRSRDGGREGRKGNGWSVWGGRTGRRRIVKVLLFVVVLLIATFFYLYELHIEIQLYSKGWVTRTILPTPALSSSCFKPSVIRASRYNTTLAYAPSYIELHAGIGLPLGRDCYDFAGTIPYSPVRGMVLAKHTVFHTYWRADLRPLGKRQISLLQSILATQDRATTSVILWTNADTTKHLLESPLLQPLLELYGARFSVRSVDKELFARGTAMEGNQLLKMDDRKAWLDGDLVRVLVLWAKGGIWVDMDTILTGRDLRVLGESEWITQWDCYDKIYQPLNGAMMHFFEHSPYLCEMLHIMSTDPLPRQGTTDWGSLLYQKLFRRLISHSIPPFKVLPYCFTDGVSCRLDNRLPDPFARKDTSWGKGRMEDLKSKVESVFAVHLHGKWTKDFPKDGWVKRFILDGVNARIRAYRLKEKQERLRVEEARLALGSKGEVEA